MKQEGWDKIISWLDKNDLYKYNKTSCFVNRCSKFKPSLNSDIERITSITSAYAYPLGKSIKRILRKSMNVDIIKIINLYISDKVMPKCSFGIIANGDMLIHTEPIDGLPFRPKSINIPTCITSCSDITYFITSDECVSLKIKKIRYRITNKIYKRISHDDIYLTDNIFVASGLLLTIKSIKTKIC